MLMSNYVNGNPAHNANGMGMMMNNAGGMNINMMNNGGYQNMFNGMAGVPPQLQMLQNQIQQTMNILQSPSLPPQTRMQLAAQLQGLQFQYGQMMQMMQINGAFGGMGLHMQQQMAIQMRQMQQMQQMQQMVMMQQQQNRNNGGFYSQQQQGYGNQGGYNKGNMARPINYSQTKKSNNAASNILATSEAPAPTPTRALSAASPTLPLSETTSSASEVSRSGAQFEENSADSPYMRVPANPKFRGGALKRERPEDFVELGFQPIKRV